MAQQNRIFLGVDGGGTGCRAMLCDEQTKPLGKGSAGAANIMTDFDGAYANILAATRAALKNAGFEGTDLSEIPAYLGLAGANIGDAATRMKKRLPFSRSQIETDARISLDGAIGSQEGAVAIIGTGSVFIYRFDGIIRTAGGWGFMVGDLASGAWLGRYLLQEVLQTYDGIHAGSPLTRRILSDFENNPQTVVEYAHTAKPGEFGTFAPLIFEFADKHDPIAQKIVKAAVSDIEETLDSVLGDHGGMFCMLGGLGPVYTNLLTKRYRDRVQRPIADAVTGAASLAVKTFANNGAPDGG